MRIRKSLVGGILIAASVFCCWGYLSCMLGERRYWLGTVDFGDSEASATKKMLSRGFRVIGREEEKNFFKGYDRLEVIYSNGKYNVIYQYVGDGTGFELNEISIRKP